MESCFIRLINMSISAGFLMLVVVLLRIILKNIPKYIRCIMWAIVGIRLICPISIQSVFSLMPGPETIPDEVIWSSPAGLTAEPGENNYTQGTLLNLPQVMDNMVSGAGDPTVLLTRIAILVWAIGFTVMIAYAAASYFLLRRKVGASVRISDDMRICDDISTPFILGIIRPCIYVPSDTETDQLISIAAHERAHIARRDHWWKPLGFLLLAIHWFNPLIWVAYVLFSRDIELACDERVIKNMDIPEKQKYSEDLLSCSISRKFIAACPLAFGEVGVKDRVKSVLNYKKPAAWILTASIVICAVVSLCFLTDPVTTRADAELASFISQTILDYNKTGRTENNFACEAHDILGIKRTDDFVTVYLLVMYNEYSLSDGVIRSECGSHIPTVITAEKNEGEYALVEYWESDDGTRYVPSIRDKFPWYLENRAIRIHTAADAHQKECIRQAEDYFGVKYTDPYADAVYTTTALAVPDIISLEEIVKVDGERAEELLRGCRISELEAVWGEHDDELSGRYGYIWYYTDAHDRAYAVTVVYLPDGDDTAVTEVIIASGTSLRNSSFVGEWKNIHRNDMGLEMTVNANYTGTVHYTSGDKLDFTWEETEKGDMIVKLVPGQYVTFRLNENGDVLLTGSIGYIATGISSYPYDYIMVDKSRYDDVLKTVDITEENWKDYFEIVERAYPTGADGYAGRLVNVFRLKDEYAGGFIMADIFLIYTQSGPERFNVIHSPESIEIAPNGGAVNVADKRTNTTRFSNDNAEIIDGLELAHGGNSIEDTFVSDGDILQWESVLYTEVQIDEIEGTLIYAVL